MVLGQGFEYIYIHMTQKELCRRVWVACRPYRGSNNQEEVLPKNMCNIKAVNP